MTMSHIYDFIIPFYDLMSKLIVLYLLDFPDHSRKLNTSDALKLKTHYSSYL